MTHKQIVKIENVMKVSRFEDLSIHAFENKTRSLPKNSGMDVITSVHTGLSLMHVVEFVVERKMF